MERRLLDLDHLRLFETFKKYLQRFETIIESQEKRWIAIHKGVANPSFGRLFHIQDIAKLLDVTENPIYRYIKRGELASIKIGNRHVFYEDDVKDFLDNNYKKARRS